MYFFKGIIIDVDLGALSHLKRCLFLIVMSSTYQEDGFFYQQLPFYKDPGKVN